MSGLREQFIVDNKGIKTGVILPIDDYKTILKELEELETIRAYDTAISSGDEAIPFDQAIREIEANR